MSYAADVQLLARNQHLIKVPLQQFENEEISTVTLYELLEHVGCPPFAAHVLTVMAVAKKAFRE